MMIANPYHLDGLIGQLNVMHDNEIPDIQDTGAFCRTIIRQILKPDYERYTQESKTACKNSLAYYLTTKSIDFDSIVSAQQECPCEIDDPDKFFLWIWEELFPGESYVVDNPEEWNESKDPAHGMLRLHL